MLVMLFAAGLLSFLLDNFISCPVFGMSGFPGTSEPATLEGSNVSDISVDPGTWVVRTFVRWSRMVLIYLVFDSQV